MIQANTGWYKCYGKNDSAICSGDASILGGYPRAGGRPLGFFCRGMALTFLHRP